MDIHCTDCSSYIAKLTVPVLLGHLFNWGLFGVLCVQIFIYCVVSPRKVSGRRWIHFLVLWIFLAEIVQTLVATIDAFRDFGTGWGQLKQLEHIGLLWLSVSVMTALISLTAQLFFAWRLYVLSNSVYVPWVVVTIGCVQAGAGIWAGALGEKVGFLGQLVDESFITTAIWLGGTVICDILISTNTLFYLKKILSNSTTQSSTSKSIINIIRVIIETALLCSMLAVLQLVLFLTYRQYNYHLAPGLTLCKLYSNSLMVVLNSHIIIISRRDPVAAGRSTFSIFDTPSMAVRMQNMPLNENNIEEDPKQTFCRALPPLTE